MPFWRFGFLYQFQERLRLAQGDRDVDVLDQVGTPHDALVPPE
jgi:hypothetical protein